MNLTAKVLEDLSVLPKLPVGIICHPSALSKIRVQLLQKGDPGFSSIVSFLPVATDPAVTPDQVEVFYNRGKWEERIRKIEDRGGKDNEAP
jgi:hypothetical protein